LPLRLIRRLAWALAVALLLSQSALRLHASQHDLHHAVARDHALATYAESQHLEVDDRDAWGHALGSAQCQWLDHLLASCAPTSQAGALQAMPAVGMALLVGPASPLPRRATRPYEARGPPRA
jgi:hypothetical protein